MLAPFAGVLVRLIYALLWSKGVTFENYLRLGNLKESNFKCSFYLKVCIIDECLFLKLHAFCFQAMYLPYDPGAIVASMCVMVCLLSLFLSETKGHELPKTINELKQWYKDHSRARGWKPVSSNRK